MSTSPNKYAVVIGLDFGTARSGYAYSWTGAARREIISRNEWPGYSGVYPKTATHSLYDQNDHLVAWGFEARAYLAQLVDSKENFGHAFAERFKMDLLLADSDGKGPFKLMAESLGGNSRKFRVITLIADYLRELKKFALDDLRKSTISGLKDQEILWCLTIPAIWSDLQKKWMRLAAQEAGLIGTGPQEETRLLLVLEPEAAALYCMENQKLAMTEGSTFMVLDCGGGTVDITMHEKTSNGLREIHKGTGGPFGSTFIDKEILNYLKSRVSSEAVAQLELLRPKDFIALLESIDRAKCSFGHSPGRPVFIGFSAAFHKILEKDFPERLEKLYEEQQDDAQLRISADLMKELFGHVLDDIFRVIDETVAATGKFNYVFMVGGFSESPYLQQCIRDRYKDWTTKIIVPKNPSSAVVEGAVSFGLDPSLIRSRRSRLTYGTNILLPFDSSRHPASKKLWNADRNAWYCEKVFDTLVKVGDEVEVGTRVTRQRSPFLKSQTSMAIEVFASKKRDISYIDESGLEKLGLVDVKIPDVRKGLDRLVEVQFSFGESELKVIAKDLTTGQETVLIIDITSAFSLDNF